MDRGAAAAGLPVLLAGAHRSSVAALRAALGRAGMGDLPISAYRVVTGLAREAAGLGDLVNRLRVSKQAMSRVVELLVQRGYCLRTPDPTDGRRSILALTDRGRHAAREIVRAFDRFDHELAARVDVADVAAARRVLEAAIALSQLPTRR